MLYLESTIPEHVGVVGAIAAEMGMVVCARVYVVVYALGIVGLVAVTNGGRLKSETTGTFMASNSSEGQPGVGTVCCVSAAIVRRCCGASMEW